VGATSNGSFVSMIAGGDCGAVVALLFTCVGVVSRGVLGNAEASGCLTSGCGLFCAAALTASCSSFIFLQFLYRYVELKE
jgi:hypothetical protein